MAGAINPSDAARNASLNALRNLIDAGAAGGKMKVYTGTRPTNANTAITSQTLLGTLTFSSTSAPDASSGVLTFSTITEDSSADSGGTIGWARITDSDDNVVFDATAGTSGGVVLTFNTLAVVALGPIQCSAFTITVAL